LGKAGLVELTKRKYFRITEKRSHHETIHTIPCRTTTCLLSLSARRPTNLSELNFVALLPSH
jgi:hypothetical protein